MNIAIIAQDLYLDNGGLELQAIRIIEYLKLFYKVYVFSSANDDRVIHYKPYKSNINKIKKILEKLNINCIIAMFSWGDVEFWYTISKYLNIKFLYSEHNDPILIRQRMSPIIRKNIMQYSSLVRVQLELYAESDNSIVIPNFVDEYHNEYDISSYDILFVGDIYNEIKNFKILYQAFQNQSFGRLIVCGKSYEYGSSRVAYLGTVSDMHEIYKSVGIVCIPSLYEGMSNTLLEAMSHNIPTIVNSKCRSNSLISNGLLFDGTEKDLEAKIRLLLTDDDLRNKISNSCNVEDYNPVKILPKWNKAIQYMET